MKKLSLLICFLFSAVYGFANIKRLPDWFVKSFNQQRLNLKYQLSSDAKSIINTDFNGDRKNDVAVLIIDIKSKKRGILILNQGQNQHYIFGAGNKFKGESFDNTNWLKGWRLYTKKIAYESLFNKDGDIIAGRKIHLKHPAIYAFSLEDEEENAGVLIYWDGIDFKSIHQGE
jgi:hypothetical protein